MKRELTMTTIINQLPDMEDQELVMIADFIHGLKLGRTMRK